MENWDSRANDIFADAVEIGDAQARQRYLDQRCGQDAHLRQHVDSLLAANDRAADFLNGAAVRPLGSATTRTADADTPRDLCGLVIGPYKLLQEIGEGGFGVVYMAEQQAPVRRQVALKIIKPGMDTKEVIARFEAERQALALMDHPNIAKVLDAGTTDDGRPYFVMELVRGVPITEFCDQNNLTPRDRLELFATVCHAVQHAHQKGVIHRDIKPTNVMITLHDARPVPKVIDFGISKAISQRLTEKTLFTRYGQMIGTPQYMSPEQAQMSGLDVDTRSDIYSLGVLLYELLTGTTPLDGEKLRNAGWAEMARMIQDEEPPKPSTRLSTTGGRLAIISKSRGTSEKHLRQLVRGDLDWIVMKALDKDRSRRYETASSFADDIRRHLADEPVTAGPPSASYRLSKFVRRKRGVVVAGSSIAAALVIGAFLATVGFVWALNERDSAQESAHNATKAQNEARRLLYASDMFRADRNLHVGTLSEVELLLNKHRKADPVLCDLRGFEWRYLWQECQGDYLESYPAHGDGVAASPDGRFIAYVHDNTIVIREQNKPWTHVKTIEAIGNAELSFSADGRFLAAAGTPETSDDGPGVTVFDTSDWKSVQHFKDGGFPVKFSHDGKWLVFRLGDEHGEKSKLQLVDVATWREGTPLSAAHFALDWWQARDCVEFSRDGKLVIYLEPREGEFPKWRFFDLVEQRRLDPADSSFLPTGGAISLSPDGRHLALTPLTYDVTEIWDIKERKKVVTLDRHVSYVTQVEYSRDGKHLVTAGGDQTVVVWNTNGYEHIQTLLGSKGQVWGLDITADCKHILSASFGGKEGLGSVKVWPLQPQSAMEPAVVGCPIGWSKGGLLITTDLLKGKIRGWRDERLDFEIQLEPKLLGESGNLIPAVAITSNDRLLIGTNKGTVKILDLDSGELKDVVQLDRSSPITAIAAHPIDPAVAVVGTRNGLVTVLNIRERRTPQTMKQSGPVAAIRFSKDGAMLAVTVSIFRLADAGLRVYDFSAGEAKEERFNLWGGCRALDFSLDGKYVADISNPSCDIVVLETESGREAGRFTDHLASVDFVAFSPDGKTLATAGNNNTFSLWHIPTGIKMVTFDSPRVPIAMFHPHDPNRLIVGSRAGDPVREVRVPSLEEIAAESAGRRQ